MTKLFQSWNGGFPPTRSGQSDLYQDDPHFNHFIQPPRFRKMDFRPNCEKVKWKNFISHPYQKVTTFDGPAIDSPPTKFLPHSHKFPKQNVNSLFLSSTSGWTPISVGHRYVNYFHSPTRRTTEKQMIIIQTYNQSVNPLIFCDDTYESKAYDAFSVVAIVACIILSSPSQV